MKRNHQARRKFLLYAVLSLFVLLAVLLTVINVVNFTFIASDADRITALLASGNGMFGPETQNGLLPGGTQPQDLPGEQGIPVPPDGGVPFGPGDMQGDPDGQAEMPEISGYLEPEDRSAALPENEPAQAAEETAPETKSGKKNRTATGKNRGGASAADGAQTKPEAGEQMFIPETGMPQNGQTGFDRFGPNSPETRASVRYFTVKIVEDGTKETVALKMNAYSESDALALAEKLVSGSETGWTDWIYRYRIYKNGEDTFVTVIDQGRELTPSYRILLISVIGGFVATAAGFLFLLFAGKRVFRPLEEADRRQKQFIASAEQQLKVPLTVIAADVECIERKSGPTDSTVSIRRQTKKMTSLTERLGDLALFEEEGGKKDVSVGDILKGILESGQSPFRDRPVQVRTDLSSGGTVYADPELLERVLGELCANAARYALTWCDFTLKNEQDRLLLTVRNDASLTEEGDVEQVFDRFTVLSNAEKGPSAGLGLSFVKEAAKANGWRLSASASGGAFILTVAF